MVATAAWWDEMEARRAVKGYSLGLFSWVILLGYSLGLFSWVILLGYSLGLFSSTSGTAVRARQAPNR